jgi:hypothetical protein
MKFTYRKCISRVLAAALFLVIGTALGTAAPVCVNASLADYVSLNSTGGCTFNDLTFFRFAFNPPPVATGGAATATPSDIFLEPIRTPSGTGFSITSSFFSLSNPTVAQSVTYGLGYSVDPPPIIVGEDLFLDPPFGDVLISQRVCLNDVLANNCAFGVALSQSVTPTSPLSSLQFPFAVPFVDIQTTISLRSTPGNPAGFDALQTGTISNVPEPASVALSTFGLLAGLAGVVTRDRRRRRNLPH